MDKMLTVAIKAEKKFTVYSLLTCYVLYICLGRGWGGIFMPFKRLMLLLNNYINLLSQVMTLC